MTGGKVQLADVSDDELRTEAYRRAHITVDWLASHGTVADLLRLSEMLRDIIEQHKLDAMTD